MASGNNYPPPNRANQPYNVPQGTQPYTNHTEEYIRHAVWFFDLIRQQQDNDLVINTVAAARYMGESNSAVEQRFVRMRDLYPGIHIRGSEADRSRNPTFRTEDHIVEVKKSTGKKGGKKGGKKDSGKKVKAAESDDNVGKSDEEESVNAPADMEDDLRSKKRQREDDDEEGNGNGSGSGGVTSMSEMMAVQQVAASA